MPSLFPLSQSAWLPIHCLLLFGAFLTLRAGTETAPSEILAESWELMRLGRWNDAERGLSKSLPDEKTSAAKLFAEATIWQFRSPGKDPSRAQHLYEEIVERHPKSIEAPWALLALARSSDLEILLPQPASAIPQYRLVMEKYPESEAAQEAALHLAQAFWEAEGVVGARRGVDELSRWREKHPDPRYESASQLLLGKLYRFPLADYSSATEHLQEALKAGLHSDPQRTSTIWTIASLAEHQLRDRDMAVQYYTIFLQDFPRHRLAFRAKQGLQRLNAPVPVIESLALPQP